MPCAPTLASPEWRGPPNRVTVEPFRAPRRHPHARTTALPPAPPHHRGGISPCSWRSRPADAYAANTIGSADVIDESLLSQDIKNAEVKTSELANNAVTRDKLASGAVINGKIGASAVTGSKVADNSLAGADILESSLAKVPSAANADTLGGQGPGCSSSPAPRPPTRRSTQGLQRVHPGQRRIFSNRVVATDQGTPLLDIPFTGEFTVDGCDHTNGRVFFDVKGTGAVYFTSERVGTGIEMQAAADLVDLRDGADLLPAHPDRAQHRRGNPAHSGRPDLEGRRLRLRRAGGPAAGAVIDQRTPYAPGGPRATRKPGNPTPRSGLASAEARA